jgi:class 3 adenylate cyclase
MLSDDVRFNNLISVLVEQSIDISHSDLAALYLYPSDDSDGQLDLAYRRGRGSVPRTLDRRSELVSFLEECRQAVVLLERKPSPFLELLLDDRSQSGIALPVFTAKRQIGILLLNSQSSRFYNRDRFRFLDSFVSLAAGMLNSARLYKELQDYLKTIEDMKRYQESIFESMTNLLITTDERGYVHYFNRAAAERLGLDDGTMSQTLPQLFGKRLSKSVLNTIKKADTDNASILGVEGIYRGGDKDMDFSLNISPLRGPRGRNEGVTLLFTDQSAEQELKQQMQVVAEERRIIKDMFASYLSEDIVQMLVDHPELVKPGGGSRNATVFFADIAGYTSFSEGKSPEYIVEVLNEFFEEAEPIVRRHKGYLDKYIGDCIMAVFGVPLDSGQEDTIRAVQCAIDLQQIVNNPRRSFFRGEAEHLRIQIGMHSGPLVAGNLGGSRRMDFTEIGDTVNVAARLEGVAGPGEIIISGDTRAHLGDSFRLDERKPAKVKGKAKPIPIFNVLGAA